MNSTRAPGARNFWRFHLENPHVYDTLVSLARSWAKTGREKCGIGMLYEVARWQIAMRTVGEPLKLNNNYRSRYARLIMQREPDLADIFEIRQLTT